MYENGNEYVLKMLAMIKKCLTLEIIWLSQNITMIQKKLVVNKMKDETGGVAIEELLDGSQGCISFVQMTIASIK